MSTTHPITPLADAEDEVVGLIQDLIRIDSTNYGDGSGPGEIAVADYVVQRLNRTYRGEQFEKQCDRDIRHGQRPIATAPSGSILD